MLPSMHGRWSEDVGQGPSGGSIFAPIQPRMPGHYQSQGPPGMSGGGGIRPVQGPSSPANPMPTLPSSPRLNNIQTFPMRRMM